MKTRTSAVSFGLSAVSYLSSSCQAFTSTITHIVDTQQTPPHHHCGCNNDVALSATAPLSRRRWTTEVVTAALFVPVASIPGRALAKESDPLVSKDKLKIYEGYKRLNYLLDNWEKETTVCGIGSDNPYLTGGKCERTPIKVMDYLGYKNTNDPLFRADRTMRRLEGLVPAGRESEYLEAVEKWIEAADEGSGMAYISSWGEANPGGGKDRVQLFIERAKKNVMDAQQSLETVIDILEISGA